MPALRSIVLGAPRYYSRAPRRRGIRPWSGVNSGPRPITSWQCGGRLFGCASDRARRPRPVRAGAPSLPAGAPRPRRARHRTATESPNAHPAPPARWWTARTAVSRPRAKAADCSLAPHRPSPAVPSWNGSWNEQGHADDPRCGRSDRGRAPMDAPSMPLGGDGRSRHGRSRVRTPQRGSTLTRRFLRVGAAGPARCSDRTGQGHDPSVSINADPERDSPSVGSEEAPADLSVVTTVQAGSRSGRWRWRTPAALYRLISTPVLRAVLGWDLARRDVRWVPADPAPASRSAAAAASTPSRSRSTSPVRDAALVGAPPRQPGGPAEPAG